jgi:hypothetical protein
MSRIPDLLFGTDTAYGRLGELGGESIRQLEGLMQPKSMAHEAFLYTSLETPNIKDFTETMKGGIYEGDNLVKILKSVREATQGDETLSYFMLNEMMPEAPKGFIPRMTDLLSDEGKEITRFKIESIDEEGKIKYAEDEKGERIKETISGYTLEDFEKELAAYNEQINKLTLTAREDQEVREEINNALTGYSQRADEFTSESEKMLRTLHQNINEAAESWRDMVYSAEIEMTRFWKRQAEDAELVELFTDRITKGLADFEEIIKRIKSNISGNNYDDFYQNYEKGTLPEGYRENLLYETGRAEKLPNSFFESGNGTGNQINWTDTIKDHRENLLYETGRAEKLPNSFFESGDETGNQINWNDTINRFSSIIEEMNMELKNQRPKEIRVIIEDRTNGGIDSMIENANSEFR